jgi:hypothetical protein
MDYFVCTPHQQADVQVAWLFVVNKLPAGNKKSRSLESQLTIWTVFWCGTQVLWLAIGIALDKSGVCGVLKMVFSI